MRSSGHRDVGRGSGSRHAGTQVVHLSERKDRPRRSINKSPSSLDSGENAALLNQTEVPNADLRRPHTAGAWEGLPPTWLCSEKQAREVQAVWHLSLRLQAGEENDSGWRCTKLPAEHQGISITGAKQSRLLLPPARGQSGPFSDDCGFLTLTNLRL